MTFASYKNRILRSEFFKNLLILTTGSGLAALFPVFASPLLTRLYTPSDFGIFSLFLSLSIILGSVACLRYDVALMLPRRKYQASQLAILALIFSVFSGLIISLILFVWGESLMAIFGQPELLVFFLALPLAVVVQGAFSTLNFYANRDKNYKLLAQNKIYSCGVLTVIKIIAGFLGLGVWGLITGQIGGVALAALVIIYHYRKLLGTAVKKLKGRFLKKLAVQYKSYAIHSTPAAFLGGVLTYLHVILFAALYDNIIVGYIALSTQIVSIPLSIIGTSFSQVFYQRISQIESKDDLAKKYKQALFALLAIGAVMVIFIWMIPAEMIVFVFGNEWHAVAPILHIMVFTFVMKFVTSAVSTVFFKTDRNDQLLILQAISVVLIGLSVYVPYVMGMSAHAALTSFTLFSVISYLATLIIGYKSIGIMKKAAH